MTDYRLPFASIENDHLRLDYLTTTGPRIVGLYVRGVKDNLLASTPEVHWETPHGEYYLHGGHRLWTAPEDPFYTCPEDGLDVIEDDDGIVVLKSPIDASGLEKEIAIRLDSDRLHLSHKITWHGDEPIETAPWTITQLRLGGMAILPLSKQNGLRPDRKLVFWPYTSIRDERLEMFDDVILLCGKAKEEACKVGNLNLHGWIACALGDALFVKRFSHVDGGRYPDMGCNVEAYVKDVCVELETLGVSEVLKTGESVVHEETWEVFAGEFPATTEGARQIKEKLSQQKNGE